MRNYNMNEASDVEDMWGYDYELQLAITQINSVETTKSKLRRYRASKPNGQHKLSGIKRIH